MAEQDPGFTFKERRTSHLDAEEVSQAEEQKEKLRKGREADKARLEREQKAGPKPSVHGGVDVITLFETLATSALAQMGLLADPGHPVPEDLRGARQAIDLLRVLKDKTAGNLTGEEQRVLDDLLYTLQMNYVQKTKAGTPVPPPPPPGA
ncbi:MAG: DUF1844 domain-containing protein [Nitrospirota bacterium]|jgi:hypothetical protein